MDGEGSCRILDDQLSYLRFRQTQSSQPGHNPFQDVPVAEPAKLDELHLERDIVRQMDLPAVPPLDQT